eukprot:m.805740 g.805740  ORF g.805740 m.805740 type:complete len:822 (+) comp23374_c0_seq3:205-2670(+)
MAEKDGVMSPSEDESDEDEFFDAQSLGASRTNSYVDYSNQNEAVPDLEHPALEPHLDLQGLVESGSLDNVSIHSTGSSGSNSTTSSNASMLSAMNISLPTDVQATPVSTIVAPPRRRSKKNLAKAAASSIPSVAEIDRSNDDTEVQDSIESPVPDRSTPIEDAEERDAEQSEDVITALPAPPPRRRRGAPPVPQLNDDMPDEEMDPTVADITQRRMRSRTPTDEEILNNVMLTCLDTGETVPLSQAEKLLPEGLNPLSFTVIKRTGEFVADAESIKGDDDSSPGAQTHTLRGKLLSAGHKAAAAASAASKGVKELGGKVGERAAAMVDVLRGDDERAREEQERAEEAAGFVKMRTRSAKTQHHEDLRHLRVVQDLSGKHDGAIWTMKMSTCGRLLATAGQDNVVRVWVVKGALGHFEKMRSDAGHKSAPTSASGSASTSGATSREASGTATGGNTVPPSTTTATPSPREGKAPDVSAPPRLGRRGSADSGGSGGDGGESTAPGASPPAPGLSDRHAIFHPKPFCEYVGHTGDVLDLSWCHSKNVFLLSSSMDKTVRLWHVSRSECLACFLHEDFVTAIAFHPRNDKYFLSGSLDCKIRLWNIPEKKVALWNEVGSEGCNLITAANFCSGGKYAVAGTYDGRCVFFNTEERLKYYTQIHARSTRGKNAKGRKISGIEPMPGKDKILVTSNDSRVRLYDLSDHSLSCKFKGATNTSSQIKATFSPDGQSIVCGSEDHRFYTWNTEPTREASRKKGWRRDRNDDYQRFDAHHAVVTVALFMPAPEGNPQDNVEHMLSADYSGSVKVYACHRGGQKSAARGASVS